MLTGTDFVRNICHSEINHFISSLNVYNHRFFLVSVFFGFSHPYNSVIDFSLRECSTSKQ